MLITLKNLYSILINYIFYLRFVLNSRIFGKSILQITKYLIKFYGSILTLLLRGRKIRIYCY